MFLLLQISLLNCQCPFGFSRNLLVLIIVIWHDLVTDAVALGGSFVCCNLVAWHNWKKMTFIPWLCSDFFSQAWPKSVYEFVLTLFIVFNDMKVLLLPSSSFPINRFLVILFPRLLIKASIVDFLWTYKIHCQLSSNGVPFSRLGDPKDYF